MGIYQVEVSKDLDAESEAHSTFTTQANYSLLMIWNECIILVFLFFFYIPSIYSSVFWIGNTIMASFYVPLPRVRKSNTFSLEVCLARTKNPFSIYMSSLRGRNQLIVYIVQRDVNLSTDASRTAINQCRCPGRYRHAGSPSANLHFLFLPSSASGPHVPSPAVSHHSYLLPLS